MPRDEAEAAAKARATSTAKMSKERTTQRAKETTATNLIVRPFNKNNMAHQCVVRTNDENRPMFPSARHQALLVARVSLVQGGSYSWCQKLQTARKRGPGQYMEAPRKFLIPIH